MTIDGRDSHIDTTRLTFFYRRLILCIATGARALAIGGRLREWQLALSL
jgi:hypothetical protein